MTLIFNKSGPVFCTARNSKLKERTLRSTDILDINGTRIFDGYDINLRRRKPTGNAFVTSWNGIDIDISIVVMRRGNPCGPIPFIPNGSKNDMLLRVIEI